MSEEATGRRVTDELKMTETQKAFLDQVTAAVAAGLARHELSTRHMGEEEVAEVVRLTLADESFQFPNGISPQDMASVIDVVAGTRVDFAGNPDINGIRDGSTGLMAVSAQMSKALANGGVPVKLGKEIKVALIAAGASVSVAGLTGTALIIVQLMSRGA